MCQGCGGGGGEGGFLLNQTLTLSSCTIQAVCTTILQAPHFLLGPVFFANMERKWQEINQLKHFVVIVVTKCMAYLSDVNILFWGEGAVKYKTVSICDHNFSKHPLNEDFFHAKMTPWPRILVCFSLKIWPLNEDFSKNFPQNLTGFFKKVPYFLKMAVFDSLNVILSSLPPPPLSWSPMVTVLYLTPSPHPRVVLIPQPFRN